MSSHPPLSTRFKARLWTRLDWALAAVCAMLIYGIMFRRGGLYVFPLTIWLGQAWVPPLLAIAVSLPVGLRRRDPVGALLLALAGCSVIVAVGGQINRGPFLPLALTLFMVAATTTRRIAVAGLIASLALLVVQGLILSLTGQGSGPATGVALILIIAWLIGLSAQQRRAYTARVREQVAHAAVTEERLRIARELHDVVAHSMTVVAVQAGFGEYVFETEPAEARAALGAIQRVTREALTDMQRMLGVLRQDAAGQDAAGQDATGQDATGEGGPAEGSTGQALTFPARGRRTVQPLQLAPAPGLADLERLVATTAVAGVTVDVTRTGDCRAVPAAVDQSAFRIVQEALTNVVKHSGAGEARVTVGYGRDLCVEITDPGGDRVTVSPGGAPVAGGPNGTGHGILGMRERVSLCGGEFSAGPLPGRGFRVAARFPLPEAAR